MSHCKTHNSQFQKENNMADLTRIIIRKESAHAQVTYIEPSTEYSFYVEFWTNEMDTTGNLKMWMRWSDLDEALTKCSIATVRLAHSSLNWVESMLIIIKMKITIMLVAECVRMCVRMCVCTMQFTYLVQLNLYTFFSAHWLTIVESTWEPILTRLEWL